MKGRTLIRSLGWSVAMLALFAVPVVADDVIHSGPDVWKTGRTFTSFAVDPIPADFFCPGSQPFTDTVHLKGVPLVTEPECNGFGVDTVIHRLDNATFHEDGTASTRIRFLALSLGGVEPLEIAGCGVYDVTASLDGEQPTTEMKLQRTSEDGGTFLAPLELDVKMVFTPRDGGEALQVHRNIKLGPGTSSFWSVVPMPEDYVQVKVDTDGDQVPDTMIPAPSNFAAGNIAVPAALACKVVIKPPPPVCLYPYCLYESCHCTPWSQNPDPFESLWNCRGYPDNLDVCHLHCVYNCVLCEEIPGEEEPTEL